MLRWRASRILEGPHTLLASNIKGLRARELQLGLTRSPAPVQERAQVKAGYAGEILVSIFSGHECQGVGPAERQASIQMELVRGTHGEAGIQIAAAICHRLHSHHVVFKKGISGEQRLQEQHQLC